MSDHAREVIAKVAEQGGAAVAVGSGLMRWLADNQSAIASIGVLAGIAIGLAGLLVNWYYQRKRTS